MKDEKQGDGSQIEIALEYGNRVIATLREPFLVLDKNLRVISTNQVFYDTFQVAEKDTIGRSLPDLGDRQWNIPGLLKLLKEIIPEKKFVKDYEVEHQFEQIGGRVMRLNACQLRVPKKIAVIIAAGAREEEEEEEELILLAIEDITERKRLQVKLKDSEERFRRAFETSGDVLLLIHKTEGSILNASSSAKKLLGYSSDELIKKKLWEISIVKDPSEFQEAVLKLAKDGITHYQDALVKTKKGLNIAVDIFLVDRAEVVQCNIRDISERKKAEKALWESQERYHALVENNLTGIIVLDTHYRINMVNSMVAGLFKKPASDFVGKNCFREFEKREAICPHCPGKRAMVSGKAEEVETQGVRDDGSRFYVRNHAVPFFGSDGVMKGFIEMIEDITERKRAEEELKAANQQLQASEQQLRASEQQLRASNQQLQASEQQLRASNEQLRANEQQLRAEIAERKRAEEELKAANQQLQANEQQLKASNQQLRASDQQLRASNQQLRASEQQLRATNQQLRANEQQLRAEIAERKRIEEEREKHLHDLEVFYKASRGREERILELKEKVRDLEEKLSGKS